MELDPDGNVVWLWQVMLKPTYGVILEYSAYGLLLDNNVKYI